MYWLEAPTRYFVYGNLRHAKRLCYMNADLYHYFIGRAGQSVQEDMMRKRYDHQLRASRLIFTAYHLDEITDKRQKAYCKHELFILLGIGLLCAKLNGSEQAEKDRVEFWNACAAYDPTWARYFRKRTLLRLFFLPGKLGTAAVRGIYRIAHLVVRFN